MLWFALGYIAGLVTAAFIAIVLDFVRTPASSVVDRIHREIQENARQVGLSQKGFIFEPPTEEDEVRERIIAQNAAEGKDTPISELM